ncbi:MAG: F0F1 ATP synthase subunit A [Bdellovibrionales bacterium]
MSHFTWIDFISFIEHELYHVSYSILACFICLFVAVLARKAIQKKEAFIPEGKCNIKGFFELCLEQISSLSEDIIGPGGRRMLPLFCFFFIFIWIQNLIGLIPGFLPPTQNINTTMALGVFSFLAYNYYGFKEHGWGYLKQFLGPVLILMPLFVFIEILSHLFRSVSLGFRLFGNMMGDHVVISIFLDLAPWFIPIIFYFLGLFVCTLQAFVFTILSMVYVSLAISHDH